MKRRVLVMVSVLVAVGLQSVPPASARAPKCFGKRAIVVGTDRSERIVGTSGRDVIIGGGGHDEIIGRGGDDLICGGSGRDDLYGDAGKDRLDGGKDDDFLAGADGHDRIVGGKGTGDFAQYLGSENPVSVDLAAGRARGWGKDRLAGVEFVGGTGHDDVLVGSHRKNLLFGQGGHDRLVAADGDDFLFGGPGDDHLEGGSGFDAADFTTATGPVVADLSEGRATGDGTDSFDSIEDLWGTAYDDLLIGDSAGNQLYGWDGADTLEAEGGNDLLSPGAGDDVLRGGSGADIADFFYFSLRRPAASRGVEVDLANDAARGHGTDSLGSIERASGTRASDELFGDSGPNRLFGLGDDDDLLGSGGDDWLDGGIGADSLDGGRGKDACTKGEVVANCESDSPPRRRARTRALPYGADSSAVPHLRAVNMLR